MPRVPEFQTRIAFFAARTQITDRWLLRFKKSNHFTFLLFQTKRIWLRHVRTPKF